MYAADSLLVLLWDIVITQSCVLSSDGEYAVTSVYELYYLMLNNISKSTRKKYYIYPLYSNNNNNNTLYIQNYNWFLCTVNNKQTSF